MTNRQRLPATLRGEIPDCVPVAPDFSNMLVRVWRSGCDLSVLRNLHTTNVMLRDSVDDVRRAARQAIDDAREGGRFILSTGDQCGRDTPDANPHAMIETARTYGRYC